MIVTLPYEKTALWGAMPFPHGSVALGSIRRDDDGAVGVLLRMPTGLYAFGLGGAIRSLPQREARSAYLRALRACLHLSQAEAAMATGAASAPVFASWESDRRPTPNHVIIILEGMMDSK